MVNQIRGKRFPVKFVTQVIENKMFSVIIITQLIEKNCLKS